jgi:hypothetical protein
VAESGAGGLTPIAGAGGGALGPVTGSGGGKVTDPPITETGEILAGAERTIVPAPVPAGTVNAAGLPQSAYGWAAPFDPADRAPYAIDWSKLLAADEGIAQIDRIVMSPQGASLGLKVDSDPPRSPVISTDGKKTQLWFVCDPAFQNDPAFAGAGVQIGVAVLIRSAADPYKLFERTGVLTVRQQ